MVAGPFRGGKRKIPNTDRLGKVLCVSEGVDHEGELGGSGEGEVIFCGESPAFYHQFQLRFGGFPNGCGLILRKLPCAGDHPGTLLPHPTDQGQFFFQGKGGVRFQCNRDSALQVDAGQAELIPDAGKEQAAAKQRQPQQSGKGNTVRKMFPAAYCDSWSACFGRGLPKPFSFQTDSPLSDARRPGCLAGRAFKGKLAAVKQNDASAQGKAQTGAALGSGSRFVNHIEGFREPVLANNFPPQLLKNLFSVSEAPALIIKVQYPALMRQPVQQSCCEDSVAKKLRPAIKAFI